MSSHQSVTTYTTASMTASDSLSVTCSCLGSAAGNNNKKVFLGISPATTEEELKMYLQKKAGTGAVKYVRILRTNPDRKSKGCAFIGFKHSSDAATFIQTLDGFKLDGMILHPEWARPSPPPANNNKKAQRGKGTRPRTTTATGTRKQQATNRQKGENGQDQQNGAGVLRGGDESGSGWSKVSNKKREWRHERPVGLVYLKGKQIL